MRFALFLNPLIHLIEPFVSRSREYLADEIAARLTCAPKKLASALLKIAVNSVYRDTAIDLGKRLGQEGFGLIFGGADVGLMGVVARTAQNQGARVTGVIPESMVEKGIAYKEADELIVSNNLRDRKEIIESKSDAFVALPGGFGTLEEIMEILTLKQLQLHNKPIVFINTKKEYKELYYISKSADAAIDYIKRYTPKQLPSEWF